MPTSPASRGPQQQVQQRMPTLGGALVNSSVDSVISAVNNSADDLDLSLVDSKYLSDTKFADFVISASSKRALAEVLKYERCSLVQAASIPVCLGPDDVIAKAKTGTGKTLAFVIPTIEKVLAHRAPAGRISALVLSPTRELARQIQTETHKMLTFHPTLSSMVVYGGVDVKKDIRALNTRVPDILIATPGRCWDLMNQPQDPHLFASVQVLVLDEADNLLDMGFRPQIAKILSRLPGTMRRQTYLFSATFPVDVKSLADVALKREHSRKSQPQRDAASAQFRSGPRQVLFSSDVSARGVDYPGVSLVVQCGIPANREQYIHRAGRTGRAGRQGQCTLLVADFERPFLDKLAGLPITQLRPLAPPPPPEPGVRSAIPGALARDPAAVLAAAVARMEYGKRARAYQSFLGYYQSHELLK
ncbi:DEAD-box ATP-dependent RNA helicase 25 [Tetrabaena socialis]|uniref:ATP-dependent RNA helicase n=1 Tax=Tetrabaena socialis TaxID=47790 RepID=A0A2J8A735_9CHLO|nr:DEAD-box ATP-dependent RNA helicase 25 [Tetrabaena socialis]|eukprot:PNH08328.1 DEAD-box ATP-dependent RNA helicase 25 [Tetrabaena socialis]